MDGEARRRQRGKRIARSRFLLKTGPNEWKVPSARKPGIHYKVDLAATTCTCPDFEEQGGAPCKHIFAARFASRSHLSPLPRKGR